MLTCYFDTEITSKSYLAIFRQRLKEEGQQVSTSTGLSYIYLQCWRRVLCHLYEKYINVQETLVNKHKHYVHHSTTFVYG